MSGLRAVLIKTEACPAYRILVMWMTENLLADYSLQPSLESQLTSKYVLRFQIGVLFFSVQVNLFLRDRLCVGFFALFFLSSFASDTTAALSLAQCTNYIFSRRVCTSTVGRLGQMAEARLSPAYCCSLPYLT